MAGVITSTNFAKALYPGVNNWFGKAYDEYPEQWKELFETEKSDRAYVEDVGISSFGLAQKKAEGQAISYDDETQSYLTRYTPVVYGLGFAITREMYEDDLYGVAGKRKAEGLAFSMRQTKEVVGANIYNRAFDANFSGADGVSMINSAHPNWAGGTQSNTLAVAADLSEASLEQACIDIQRLTNDRGLRVSITPRSLHIPTQLMFEAQRILETEYRVGTNNNDVNVLYKMGKFPGGVHVNQYFTDSDAWFIRTNCPDGMKHIERRGREFTIDNDFDTENAKYKATDRYAFGHTDYRSVYGSAGA